MKKLLLLLLTTALLNNSCELESRKHMQNPLLQEFNTPFGAPPFDIIEDAHFYPAIQEALKQHNQEIMDILANPAEPDFNNTIAAYERSGLLLQRTQLVFNQLNNANTNNELEKVAMQIGPEVTRHMDAIRLNEELFKRIRTVYDKKDQLGLDAEDARLIQEIYTNFVRGGANLPEEKRARFREINEQLSSLSIQFGQNVLAEINNFKLVIDNQNDLSGLPGNVIETAAKSAANAGLEGKWLFTVHKPSLIPFITYAENRDLREKLFKGYINLGDNGNEHDNNEIIQKIISLRAERANILGYKTHADYILERNMAKTPETVLSFLDQIWEPALKVAKNEARELQSMIDREGGAFKLESWDWWYYSEKIRKEKYEIDEGLVREYFPLESVRDGAFKVIQNLFGMSFHERSDIPKYHEDVEVYEVKDLDGSHLGILYMDYFPRASKRSGAWMSSFRRQYILDGENIRPLVTNTFNFSTPTADKPALLTFEETLTLYHELGHALHGLLSQSKYNSLSGTAVPRDFVELPSQVMENWAADRDVIQMYAKHYKTGEPIPADILDKLEASEHFNQGFITVEYMAACYLDMDLHTLEHPAIINVPEFEKASVERMGLIPEIILRYRSTYFNHAFSWAYSAGYYSYIWAEVLDSDAFMAFKETSLFDQETALSFRQNILERGGTDDPMTLYINFRGKEPDITALLRKRGLL